MALNLLALPKALRSDTPAPAAKLAAPAASNTKGGSSPVFRSVRSRPLSRV